MTARQLLDLLGAATAHGFEDVEVLVDVAGTDHDLIDIAVRFTHTDDMAEVLAPTIVIGVCER